jgi:hypothetical protein
VGLFETFKGIIYRSAQRRPQVLLQKEMFRACSLGSKAYSLYLSKPRYPFNSKAWIPYLTKNTSDNSLILYLNWKRWSSDEVTSSNNVKEQIGMKRVKRRVAITIGYIGTNYSGLQKQQNNEAIRSRFLAFFIN